MSAAKHSDEKENAEHLATRRTWQAMSLQTPACFPSINNRKSARWTEKGGPRTKIHLNRTTSDAYLIWFALGRARIGSYLFCFHAYLIELGSYLFWFAAYLIGLGSYLFASDKEQTKLGSYLIRLGKHGLSSD